VSDFNRANDEWQTMVKSGNDVNTVVAALSAIAPYWPDGETDNRIVGGSPSAPELDP
jgi:hypothetical protein